MKLNDKYETIVNPAFIMFLHKQEQELAMCKVLKITFDGNSLQLMYETEELRQKDCDKLDEVLDMIKKRASEL